MRSYIVNITKVFVYYMVLFILRCSASENSPNSIISPNHFAEEAIKKGSAYVVVDEVAETTWAEKYAGKLIVVGDVLQTLQQLSGYHRRQFKCPVLGITGSNGKTTTKELVAAILSKKFKTYSTKGNLNNHIGVPLTLLSINKDDAEFAVIEMGANHVGEIASYCAYAQPGFGLITNVGYAHLEGFGSFEGVVKGKTELYESVSKSGGKVFVSSTDDILMQKAAGLFAAEKILTYGTSESAFCKGAANSQGDFLSVQAEGLSIQTNLVGDYNFDNVMSAVCIGKYFGVPLNDIKSAIENYVPSNNRSQKQQYGNNTIILDAYNANPSSMAEAIKNFGKINATCKVAILGEMMELGEFSEAEHRKIKSMTDTLPLEKKVFVGKGFAFTKEDTSCVYFEKTEDLKIWFLEQWFNNCTILIKGSRKNELEKILAQ